jgi:hypothetical protein
MGGRRLAGQVLACGWCGQAVSVKARGPVPKWCSGACRQRAWSASRAASAGAADRVRVVDREVLVVRGDGPGWVEHLGVLAGQLAQGPAVVADHDLDAVVDAVGRVTDALAVREQWRGRFEPWE